MLKQEIENSPSTSWIHRALLAAAAILVASLLLASSSRADAAGTTPLRLTTDHGRTVGISGGRHVLIARARRNVTARSKNRVVHVHSGHSSESTPTPTPTPTPSPETTKPVEEATKPPAQEAPEQPAPETTPIPTPEPTPETPAETTAPAGKNLFSSNFTNGLAGWSLGGVGEVIPKVVKSSEGPYCEVTLEGSQGRSELIMGENLHIVEGETVLYEFEEFIVPGFAYGSQALGWNLFTQFKSDGEGSPMFGLDLWNENGKKGLWVEPEPDPNYFVAPMAEGVWHKIAIQITGSSHGAGGWVLSLDGKEIDRKTGRNTIRPGKTFAYIKNGLYRSGPTINATSHLRVRDVSLYELSR